MKRNNGRFCASKTDKCIFRLCNISSGRPGRIGRRLLLRGPNIPSLEPLICRRSLRDPIRRVISTGEADVIDSDGGATALSAWNPTGVTVNPELPPDFFFAGNVAAFLPFDRSTIYRKPFNGNQMQAINETCIRLPIHSYEKKSRRGGVINIVNTKRRKTRDCLSFVAWPTYLMFLLEWDTKDDIDLRVIEPDNSRLDKFNPTSPNTCGSYSADRKTEVCGDPVPPGGTEIVRYRVCEPPAGTFTVQANHFSNCGDGPTNWILRVTRNGDEIFREEGTSDGELSSQIFSINVPVS